MGLSLCCPQMIRQSQLLSLGFKYHSKRKLQGILASYLSKECTERINASGIG